MADLTAVLARLEQLARAVPAESIGPEWWTVETLMLAMKQDHICDADAAFIEACDPDTIMHLVRVARAAQALMHPQQMSSGYFQKRQREADETALRAALEELNTAARLSDQAQWLEVTQR